ncbi:hypothetical protein [Radiobacillus sp. PE A8.2]|uniref:hypothetical protein n=1 Tax=Radiobacillus sp. PE A8.2 TaxID=3380349 RepID=UPI003890D645
MNNSVVPAEYTILHFFIDTRLKFRILNQFDHNGTSDISVGESIVKAEIYSKYLAIPDQRPILYGVSFNITNGPVGFYYPKEPGTYYIHTKLATANMEPSYFTFFINYDGKKLK